MTSEPADDDSLFYTAASRTHTFNIQDRFDEIFIIKYRNLPGKVPADIFEVRAAPWLSLTACKVEAAGEGAVVGGATVGNVIRWLLTPVGVVVLWSCSAVVLWSPPAISPLLQQSCTAATTVPD